MWGYTQSLAFAGTKTFIEISRRRLTVIEEPFSQRYLVDVN
jgi:hypothetical protein